MLSIPRQAASEGSSTIANEKEQNGSDFCRTHLLNQVTFDNSMCEMPCLWNRFDTRRVRGHIVLDKLSSLCVCGVLCCKNNLLKLFMFLKLVTT